MDQNVSGTNVTDGTTSTAGTATVDSTSDTLNVADLVGTTTNQMDQTTQAGTQAVSNQLSNNASATSTNTSSNIQGMTFGEILGSSFGQQPEGGGGGTAICTVYHDFGYLNGKIWLADERMGQRLDERTMRGYHLWGVPFASYLRRKGPQSRIVKLLKPFVLAWAEYIGSRMFVEIRPNKLGAVMYHIGIPICKLLGIVLVCAHTRTERRFV